MAKSPRKGYLQSAHPKERKQYIDYDYIDKLSNEEKEWLGRFTDEEYGASFEVNPIFVKLSDLPKELRDMVKDNIRHKDDLVQIYKNTIPGQINLDLRKIRSCTQYYKTKTVFSTNKKYRYSDNNISNPNDRDRNTEKVRNIRNDMWNVGLKDGVNLQSEEFNNMNIGRKVLQHHMLDEYDYEMSHEDFLILQEEVDLEYDLADKGLRDPLEED